MRVTRIRDEDTFARLGVEWNAVLEASRQDNAFQRHEWLQAWWRAYGRGARLAVLTCRDPEGELLGVLPLFERRGPFGARTLRFLGDQGVGGTGLGVFARSDVEDEVAARLAAHLLETTAEWDVLDLRAMDSGAGFFRDAVRSPSHAAVYLDEDRRACPRIALTSDWESFLTERLGKHARWAVRRCRRRTEKAGAGFELVTDAAALPAAMADLTRLFEGRMRSVVGPRFHMAAPFATFMADAFPQLLAEDRLRLGFLTLDGERVAAEYQVRYGETMYALIGGFDERWAQLEVYKALFSHMVEAAIAEGCRVLDFRQGEQEYKFTWGVTDVQRFSDARLYGRSPAARLAQATDTGREWATRAFLASPAALREPILRALGKTARRAGRPSHAEPSPS